MKKVRGWVLASVSIACSASPLLAFVPQDSEDGSEKKSEKRRFDLVVREDIFAGFSGDDDALKRGAAECDKALKEEPKNAEAMVWRGAIRVFQAGQLFGKNNPVQAFPLWTSGLKDMDEAVKLEPDNVGVRIPRAAVLLPSARNAPPAMSAPLLKIALDDFEFIYKKQEKNLDDLGTHPRGELRMGLQTLTACSARSINRRSNLRLLQRNFQTPSMRPKQKSGWLRRQPQNSRIVASDATPNDPSIGAFRCRFRRRYKSYFIFSRSSSVKSLTTV